MTEYCTIDEIATLYKVSPSTVEHELKRGSLNALRFGSQVRIPKDPKEHWAVDPTYKTGRGKRTKGSKATATEVKLVESIEVNKELSVKS